MLARAGASIASYIPGLRAIGFRSATFTIASGARTKSILFSSEMPPSVGANYVLLVTLTNLTDASPQKQFIIPVAKASTGFSIELDNMTITANTLGEYIALPAI